MIIDTQPFSKQIALEALHSIDFEWTRQLQSVWRDPPYHVDDLNGDVAKRIIAEFLAKTKHRDSTPLGEVVVGTAGSGKTHLIGTLRRLVWEKGGWFVLLDFAGIKDFWASAALWFVTSLNQVMPSGETQYQAVLSRLVASDGFEPRIRTLLGKLIEQQDIAVQIQRETVRGFIQAFLVSLDRAYPGNLSYPDIVRACLLLILGDWDARNIAYSWLQGLEICPEDLRALGFGLARPRQIELVRGMSWLMGLAGPTLIAIDHIDSIVSEANLRRYEKSNYEGNETVTMSIIESLAGGLMDLHNNTCRSMTVLSCIEATWDVLKDHVTVAMTDRFRPAVKLASFKNSETACRIVAARLEQAYADVGFPPPYPTWPFAPEAFETAIGFSPRQLLRACDEHRERCLAQGEVSELFSFKNGNGPIDVIDQRSHLDVVLEEEKKKIDPALALETDSEDRPLSDLLIKALHLYVAQTQPGLPDHVDLTVTPDITARAPLHGRLTFTYHEEGDRERHYCFRALSHTQANAFQGRLKAAMTESGIVRPLAFRHLFILRRDNPPSGRVTSQLVGQFTEAGGKFIAPTEDDIRTILALHKLAEAKPEGFSAWLQARKPLYGTTLFQMAGLCGEVDFETADGSKAVDRVPAAPTTTGDAPSPQIEPSFDAEEPPSSSIRTHTHETSEQLMPIGRRIEGGGPGAIASLSVKWLPKHIVLLAGSGSGKTVLLRRIIEEAALLHMPAIVLDTNNDLARLGDSWPTRPDSFTDDDIEKTKAYARDVEVLVWTPGLSGGRPLQLSVLPDFSALGDDPDERAQAVEMARATLLPFLGANPRTEKGKLKAGVLADALRGFASLGGKSLEALIEYLRDLPDEASRATGAAKLALDVANQLNAEISLNPLLASQGTPLDPQELFGNETGPKTRISVINFSGLPSDQSRQSFVNQLQMALFTFIKKHPSLRGRLYAMDEAQNFAPSQKSTPCKESTLSLAAQARKYGLGMIFATQTPRGIDNKIVSNCTTHFYGKMNSPTTIEATQELVAAKGGRAQDIAKLPTGTFYFATEGSPRPVKVSTPLCLTHHPQNPLGSDEVVSRARNQIASP